jgi:saccharopine dehydrogenase-like NADP-dependent oxidoreductase
MVYLNELPTSSFKPKRKIHIKVLIIGCGAVGTAAATLLAKEQDIDKVYIGDINLHNAPQTVEALQELSINAKIDAVQIDASDEASVAKAARGSSLVYNGASSACNLPILKACIHIGSNYIDTAAELPLPGVGENANIANLMALDDKAKAAGILAITCMGIGPGYTNISVHHIVNQMDTAEQVKIKWFDLLEADDLIGTWTPAGLMGEFLGGPHPVIWQDGKLAPSKFLYSESHDFPEPVGKRTVYTATFHPELWMLPNYLPNDKGKSIKYIDMMGGMDIGNLSMKDVWLTAIQRQAIKEKFERPLETGQDMIAAFGSSFKTFANFKAAVDSGIIRNEVNTVSTEVTGIKNGKKIKHTMFNTTVLSETIKQSPLSSVVGFCTAQCGVTVALMVLRNKISQKGVITPDQLESPEDMLKTMDPKAFRIEEKIEHQF